MLANFSLTLKIGRGRIAAALYDLTVSEGGDLTCMRTFSRNAWMRLHFANTDTLVKNVCAFLYQKEKKSSNTIPFAIPVYR